jgi:transcriptional regulator with XRE-family HTH domain
MSSCSAIACNTSAPTRSASSADAQVSSSCSAVRRLPAGTGTLDTDIGRPSLRALLDGQRWELGRASRERVGTLTTKAEQCRYENGRDAILQVPGHPSPAGHGRRLGCPDGRECSSRTRIRSNLTDSVAAERITVPGHVTLPSFGARIRMARAYAEISREDLAARLEISDGLLRRIESGRRTLRPFEESGYAQQVAEITGLPVAFFHADLERLLSHQVAEGDLTVRLETRLVRIETLLIELRDR